MTAPESHAAIRVLDRFLVAESEVVATFTLDGEPVSKARARFTGRGSSTRAYTPEKTRVAEERVAWSFRQAGGQMEPSTEATFGVIATFHNGTRQRRDVDNMLKLILDGLNGVAWVDDMQVNEVIGRKFYAGSKKMARTEVVVYRTGRDAPPTEPCVRCGAPFRTYESWLNNPQRKKYCSPECGYAHRRELRERTCKECGETFHVHGETHDTQFCSLECRYAGSRKTRKCPACGDEFTRPTSAMRVGSTCSHECRMKIERERGRERRKQKSPGKCLVCGAGTSRKEYRRCNVCKLAGRPIPTTLYITEVDP